MYKDLSGIMNQLEELLKKIQEEFETIFTNIKGLFTKKDSSTANSDDGVDTGEETKSELPKEQIEDIRKNDNAGDTAKKKSILNGLDINTLRKKAPMIILVIAFLYLAVDTFLLNKEEEVITPAKVTKVKKPVKKKEPVVTLKEEVKKEIKEEVIQAKEEKDIDASEVPLETPITVTSPRSVGENTEVIEEETLEDQISSAVETVVSEEEKIISDYISPPRYHRFGRGLIYNCKGKHWACVDQYSFLKCRENEKWNEQNNKNEECKTRNVYATSSDCIKVQTYYTNNSENTDFCERK